MANHGRESHSDGMKDPWSEERSEGEIRRQRTADTTLTPGPQWETSVRAFTN